MALYIGDILIAGNIDGQQLNNPFSLLDYKYSEYALENASWLLSNGQWNSGAVYQSVYDLLLQIYNGTVTKAGVSVKLSTETYTDTDFVLNTTDTTFRLPIKVLMAGSKRVAGNGMTLGLMGSDGVTATGFKGGLTNINNVSNAGTVLSAFTGVYGQGVGIQSGGSSVSPYNTTGMGITTDETKSGIETSANGLYLYFYVGETVQDANIIAAASVLTDIADLKARSIIETYVNGTSWYRVYSDGWCEQGGRATVPQGANVDITFLIPYANTDYYVNGNQTYNWAINPGGYVNAIFGMPRTDGFSMRASTGPLGSIWMACGYIS
ncbi:MAG: hypothetical protein IKK52_02645 [Alphaproteobacteria bacterium]|nr:hypothetical protein [Alphaproteobacteria bacterium]